MNKTDLVAAVAAQAGLTKVQAQKAVEATVDAIAGALKGGDKVQLVGFGTLEVKEVAAKTGINPQTKEKVEIAASKKPVMKFGKAYKDLFN